MKFYKIQTCYGDYKIISFNKNIALFRAYLNYRKTRKNTSFKKFKSSIFSILINE